MNEQAKKLGLVGENNVLVDGKRNTLLELRADPKLSIIAAAEYDKMIFDRYENQKGPDGKRYLSENLTPDEMAHYLYIAHHEGESFRYFLAGKYNEDGKNFKNAVNQNIGSKAFEKLVDAEKGDRSKAYINWMNNYAAGRIAPWRFREEKK